MTTRQAATRTYAEIEADHEAASALLRALNAAAPPRNRPGQIEAFRRFLEDPQTLSRRNQPYEPATVHSYVKALASLNGYLDLIGFPAGFETIAKRHLDAYLTWYVVATSGHNKAPRERSASGRKSQQANLMAFFSWLSTTYKVANIFPDRDRRLRFGASAAPKVIPKDSLSALLQTVGGEDAESIRNYAIIHCLMTGMRISHLTSMRVENTVFEDVGHAEFPYAVVDAVKHAKSDVAPPKVTKIYLPVKTVDAVQMYLRVRAGVYGCDPDNGAMWMSRNRGLHELTDNGIRHMIRDNEKKANLQPGSMHPHLFRHTFVYLALKEGMPREAIKHQMQWASEQMIDLVYAREQTQNLSVIATAAMFRRRGNKPWGM